jgi:hypothetical protein
MDLEFPMADLGISSDPTKIVAPVAPTGGDNTALQIKPMAAPTALGNTPPDPNQAISLAGGIANIQNARNANTNFQAEFAAKQKFGQILAKAPDTASAIAAARADPSVAPFVGSLMQEQGSIDNTLTQGQSLKLDQQSNVAQGYFKNLAIALNDPSQLGKVEEISLSALPPALRGTMKDTFDKTNAALRSGLDLTKPQDQATFKQRVVAAMTAAGAGGNAKDILGTATTRDTSEGPVSGLQAAPQYGGGFKAAGGGAPQGQGVPSQGGQGSPAAPEGVVGSPQGQSAPTPSAGPAKSDPGPLAGDGKPLYVPGTPNPTGTGLRTDTGMQAFDTRSAALNKGLIERYTNGDVDLYKSAQQGQQGLQSMEADLDKVAAGGAFTQPGAYGASRLDVAKAINTFANMTGMKLPFDPETISGGEALFKETQRLGAQVTQNLAPGGHNAASTISNLTKAVPGIDNTYLGAKLLITGYKQLLQRDVDYHDFQTQWLADHNNTLVGSDVAFNKAHPPQEYANVAYDQMGMTDKGFKSPQNIVNAVKQGWLSPQEAINIRKQQFPNGGK